MNLEQAIASSELRRNLAQPNGTRQERKSLDVARRVFEVSAMADQPYVNIKPEEWAQRWLTSQTFVLAEIAPHHVAVPYANRINRSKVQATLQCSAEEIEPIVIDINKQGIGSTNSGYIPKVIVVDGKHRHRAQVLRGKDRIMAWVGDLAMAELQKRNNPKQFVIKAAANPFPEKRSKLSSFAEMFCAVTGPVVRQDTGDGGSRPTGGTQVPKMSSGKRTMKSGIQRLPGGAAMPLNAFGGGPGASATGGSGMNPARKGIFGQMARGSGQLEEADPSDTNATPDPSDRNKTFPDPSDRRQWKLKPQTDAPGSLYKPFRKKHDENDTSRFDHNDGETKSGMKISDGMTRAVVHDDDPEEMQPGTGIGPRVKTLDAGPIRVKRIVTSPKKKGKR